MNKTQRQEVAQAIGQIPSGLFILTACNGEDRTGMLVSWVQQVCFEPPIVCVAVGKDRPIMPVIGESRQFGLCQVPKGDKTILRRFASGIEPGEDPMEGFAMVEDTVTRVPVLADALSYIECELADHVDVQGDHDLFVGRIVGGRYLNGEPDVRIRKDGFKY